MRMIVLALLSMMLATSCSAEPLKTYSFTVEAVDEAGFPVSNAVVRAGFYRFPRGGNSTVLNESVSVSTDTNGLCTVTGKGSAGVYWEIGKDGYYSSYAPKYGDGTANSTNIKTGKLHYKIAMRKIGNPIPMYAKYLRGVHFPILNGTMSYDLEKGDWLPPYGKGAEPDFVFHLSCQFGEDIPGNVKAYDATLSLAFSNEDDGILDYVESQVEGSVFHLPRYAPETGYTNQWSLHKYENIEGSSYSTTRRNEDMNHFFRVRTQKDKDGNIISAHYGKIRGPLWFGVASGRAGLSMRYYLNPNPNDRNMEFDPKQNLFTNLSQDEKVNDP